MGSIICPACGGHLREGASGRRITAETDPDVRRRAARTLFLPGNPDLWFYGIAAIAVIGCIGALAGMWIVS